jgi:hypothetical protein
MLPFLLTFIYLPRHTILGGWIVSKGAPVISMHFDDRYTLFHDARRKSDMYIETGNYVFRENRLELRVTSARVSYPPKIALGTRKSIPWPARPVKPEHPSVRVFRLHWIDADHFRVGDGRVFWRRKTM